MSKPVPEKIEEENKSTLSRREFLRDAGIVLGGASVGSLALVNACKGDASTTTATTTETVTASGQTVTKTVVDNQTITVTQLVETPTKLPTFNINGVSYAVDVDANWTLADLLTPSWG
jgi:hypothetical protein